MKLVSGFYFLKKIIKIFYTSSHSVQKKKKQGNHYKKRERFDITT